MDDLEVYTPCTAMRRLVTLIKQFLLLSIITAFVILVLHTSIISDNHTSLHRLQETRNEPENYYYKNHFHKRVSMNLQTDGFSFSFRDNFSFPQPQVMRPISEIDSSQFLHDLRHFLLHYSSERPLALITSNYKYVDVLLNWLISATVRSGIPLESVLVLSLDAKMHALLTKRGISSILTMSSDLIRSDIVFNNTFDAIMMIRLSAMRIISHFGFDIVMYDTDAIILKDPQPLYERLYNDDIIGSVGRIPYHLLEEWGITICIGMVLIRSSQLIETYWNSMKDICTDSVDDQTKLNCGLKALEVHWSNTEHSFTDTTIQGRTQSGLHVSILQHNLVCRKEHCESSKRDSYYIWHKGGHRSRKQKLFGAREGRTWFLRHQWQLITNALYGVEWLDSICYPGATHE